MLTPRLLRRTRSRGFTLVEALVAIGLTTILLWGLLQLYSSATAFSSAVTVEAELCSAGRAVLERMVRELSAATVRGTYNMQIGGGGDFNDVAFYAPVGSGGNDVVQVQYRAAGTGATRSLERKIGASNWASFGLDVRRFKVYYIDANGNAPGAPPNPPHSFSSELPLAVRIELLISDSKDRATIALSSSAFLPGSGL